MLNRTCEHPHKVGVIGEAWSRSYAAYPTEPDGLELVLVLTTDGGRVPYCLADNPRSRAAITYLGMRFGAAKLIRGCTYEPPTDENNPFTDELYLPQMVLSQALAEREGRFCIADSFKPKIAAAMRAERTDT